MDKAWQDRTDTHVHKHGPVAGALVAKGEQRSARLQMLQDITTPTDEELSLARGKSDHALLEQMHQAGRATDTLPPPLHLATEQVKQELRSAEVAELRQAVRVKELNDQYHKAKAQGADEQQLAKLDEQRDKARQMLTAAREWQRDSRAEQAAIQRRTQQLQRANDDGGRVLSRAIAAAKTLADRSRDLQRWMSIIAHPTREEERAVALGGRQTPEALAAENHPDRTRRVEAVRDRAQMGQLIAANRPQPVTQEKTRTRSRTRKRGGCGRGR